MSGVDNRGSGSSGVVSEQKLRPLSHTLQVNVLTPRMLDNLRRVCPAGVGLLF